MGQEFNRLYQLSKDGNIREAIKWFERVMEIDGHETKEKLQELQASIESAVLLPAMKRVLLNRVKTLTRRLNTKVPPYFGAFLLQRRKELGYSLKEMSILTNNIVSPSYWHRIEKGDREHIGTAAMQAIAKAIKVDVNELLALSTPKDKEQIPLDKLILENRLMIQNSEVSLKQKQGLLKILDLINQSSWNNESKHKEAIHIVYAIEQYKSLFKEAN